MQSTNATTRKWELIRSELISMGMLSPTDDFQLELSNLKVKQQQDISPKDFKRRLDVDQTKTVGTEKPKTTIRPLFKGQEVERSM